ncbi:MAG: cysteine hydrolase family protein [Marinomonas sp.]
MSQSTNNKSALIIIDPQNDYLPGGKYPLWNMETSIKQIIEAMDRAKAKGMSIYFVQHIAPEDGPFFQKGSEGADIIAVLKKEAPDAKVVQKEYADSFEQTELNRLLKAEGIEDLVLCGMMTQNCITHTALSKTAEEYQVSILSDACTTVDEMVHNIALAALSVRCTFRQTDSL